MTPFELSDFSGTVVCLFDGGKEMNEFRQVDLVYLHLKVASTTAKPA